MSLANEPAYPYAVLSDDAPGFRYQEGGLTKREYFAAMAMQGLLADGAGKDMSHSDIAYSAARCADALLAELEKQP